MKMHFWHFIPLVQCPADIFRNLIMNEFSQVHTDTNIAMENGKQAKMFGWFSYRKISFLLDSSARCRQLNWREQMVCNQCLWWVHGKRNIIGCGLVWCWGPGVQQLSLLVSLVSPTPGCLHWPVQWPPLTLQWWGPWTRGGREGGEGSKDARKEGEGSRAAELRPTKHLASATKETQHSKKYSSP